MKPNDLQAYRAELVTNQPVSLGIESEVAFRRDIHRHVPGMVLRGALAALWIGEHGKPTGDGRERFRRLFEVGIRPGPLLLAGSFIQPLSVSWCKYPPDEVHRERSFQDEAFAGGGEPRTRCGVDGCSQPVDRGKGEVEFPADVDPLMTTTHVPHEADGRARDRGLHARRYLRADTRFTGRLHAVPDEFLDRFAGGADIWLGGRRTVAGRARLTLTPEDVTNPSPVDAGATVVLRLETAGVFVDAAGRPLLDLPRAGVARCLGFADDPLTVTRSWSRPVAISGWHAATNLPKPTDRAVAPGSTWLVRTTQAIPAGRLAALVRDGVGLRRAEGFGRIAVVPERQPQPASVAAPTRGTERAVAQGRRLWRYATGRREVGDGLVDYLRALGGRPPGEWPRVSDEFWQQRSSDLLKASGVPEAVRPLVNAGDAELVRDVRCVLEAARGGGRPIPQWLRAPLTAEEAP